MSQESKRIKTEELETLFHLQVTVDKKGLACSHVQIHGQGIDIQASLMKLLIEEPKIKKILKEALKNTKGFKKAYPKLVKDHIKK